MYYAILFDWYEEKNRINRRFTRSNRTALGKPLTRAQRADLPRLNSLPDSEIDYSVIPPPSEERLSRVFQPNRHLVAVRLEREGLRWLRDFGPGYSTRINDILRAVMEQTRHRSA